jgi:toxin co-regulated pilus biosynthesis protein T
MAGRRVSIATDGSGHRWLLTPESLRQSPILYRWLHRAQGLRGVLFVPDDLLNLGQGAAAPVAAADLSAQQEEIRNLVGQALVRGASDMHFIRDQHTAELRFRVNGTLETIQTLGADRCDQLLSVLYNVEAASKSVSWNRREPQDAMAEMMVGPEQRRVRVRYAHAPVSSQVGASSYHAVLRLLAQKESSAKGLDSLGYALDQVELLRKCITVPTGLFVMAGSTGSGKSTTIRHLLEWLARDFHEDGACIVTVEDPVESRIRGSVQSSVVRRTDGGATNPFLPLIYSAMRRDPDVLFIGETRDPHTAKALVDCVESGHLGITTIHANGVIGVIQRLKSLGVEGQKISAPGFWAGIVCQTLVRTSCPHCALPAGADEHHTALVQRMQANPEARDLLATARFINRKGCERCAHGGISGRTVVAEFLYPYDEIVELLGRGTDYEIYQTWKRCGEVHKETVTGIPMRERARTLVASGRICPSEFESKFGLL